MPTRYLIMDTAISDEKAHTFIQWTTAEIKSGIDHFYIALSTTGGNVNAGLLMANYIKSLPVKFTMHNVSLVASIGIPIYASATHRVTNLLSSFVFHGSGQMCSDRLDENRLTDLLQSTQESNNMIARAISTNTDMEFDAARELLRGEISKSAQWAKENGICHEISDFKLPPDEQLINLF